MRFGLAFASNVGFEGPDALELCRRAQDVGFESVWCGEHVVIPSHFASPYPYAPDGKIEIPPDRPIPDPLIWLAFVAAAAPALRLGTCILIVPQRNPVVLAKELATLDRLSGGRLELGLGVGWLREEFDAIGVPWERRGARNDEYVAAMRALWAGPHAEFHGTFVDFDPVTSSPFPAQASIPILVGGDTEVAIGRAARIADGYFPGEASVDRLAELIRRVRAACEARGRDPRTMEIDAMFGAHLADPVAGAERLAAVGVDRVMVPAFAFAGPGGLDRLGAFGDAIAAVNGRG